MNTVNLNNSISSVSFGSKKKKNKNNVGFYGASIASSVAVLPLTQVNKVISKAFKKASMVNLKENKEINFAANQALRNIEGGKLYDKGVRILRAKEVSLSEKEYLEHINSNLKTLFSKLEDINPDELVKSFSKVIIPYEFDKKDSKVLMALYDAQVLAQNKKANYFKFFEKYLKKQKPLSVQEKEILANNNKIMKSTNDVIAKFVAKINLMKYKAGLNAGFMPTVQKIIMPDKSLQPSVFHEMGHASNFNGLLKPLVKVRMLAPIAAGAILTLSLLNPRKNNEEKSDNKIKKLNDNIKRNAGKLSFLAMVPVIMEEGIASLKGNNIIKNLVKDGLLSKDILKKVRKTNALGLMTYVISAIATGVGAKVAVDVKDKIQDKYDKKQEKKQALKEEKKVLKAEKKANKALLKSVKF